MAKAGLWLRGKDLSQAAVKIHAQRIDADGLAVQRDGRLQLTHCLEPTGKGLRSCPPVKR